ncbi:MAG: hypothetical protein ACR2PZ_12955 [Pseudomonadales bacterium]
MLEKIQQALLLLMLLLLCARLNAEVVQYRVDVEPDLRTVSVQARFAQPVEYLNARAARAGDLGEIWDCEQQAGAGVAKTLSVRGVQRLRLSRPLRCLAYRARLRPLDRGGFQGSGAIMSTPRQWLWLPRLSQNDRVVLTLNLPAKMQASVPWARRAGRYEFGPSPESGDGLALFGRFPVAQLSIPGGQLPVALASAQSSNSDWQTWQRWLQAAVNDVSAVGGRFPNPDAQILLVPSKDYRGQSPVPFGHVVRDMGEAVRFFVEPGRALADYLNDWTASHEFAHLLLPYVQDKWVSEGFASYYQNLLMARRGAYSQEELWQRLNRSFNRAAAIAEPPTLARLADDEFWRVRMLVYWSGAAVALLADTQLRESSGGVESLDTVLARLQRCCLPASKSLSGEAFFALLDSHSPQPLFVGLYDAFAHAPGMPTVADLFKRLGVLSQGDQVRLLDSAPLALVRQQIGTQSVVAEQTN